MPDEHPIVKLSLSVEVDVRLEDNVYVFDLYGHQRRFICPDHMASEYDIKTCFLDTLEATFRYAHEPDEKLTKGAQDLKEKVLESIKIVRE